MLRTPMVLSLMLFAHVSNAQSATASPPSMAGYFASDTTQIYCDREGDRFVGKLKMAAKAYPFQARLNLGEYQGQFHDGVGPVDFTAVVEDGQLTFRSGGASATLKREVLELAGLWQAQGVALNLKRDGDAYIGTVDLQGKPYTFAGQVRGDTLSGPLQDSVGGQFDCRLEHHGNTLVLTSGDAFHAILRRESVKARLARISVDIDGQFVIAPKWKRYEDFSEGRAAVQDANERWGYIDTRGDLIAACQWYSARPFSQGLAAVTVKERGEQKVGFVNLSGQYQIPAMYGYSDTHTKFSDGLCLVHPGGSGNVAYINTLGETLIGPFFANKSRDFIATSFSEGLAHIGTENSGLGGVTHKHWNNVIDIHGNNVTSTGRCEWVGGFHDGVARRGQSDNSEFFTTYDNKNGSQLCSTKALGNDYVTVGKDFSEGFAVVEHFRRSESVERSGRTYYFPDSDSNYKHSLIDKSGEALFSTTKYIFTAIKVSQGRIPVQLRDGPSAGGFMNTAGDLVVPCHWRQVRQYREGLAAVQAKGGGWGYLDLNGELAFPCVLEDAGEFHDGLAFAKRGGKWGCIKSPLLTDDAFQTKLTQVEESTARLQRKLQQQRLASQQKDQAMVARRLQLPFPLDEGDYGTAISGYCPVTLVDDVKLKKGRYVFRTTWQGRSYSFTSFGARRKFLANPDKYAPVLAGFDPVKLLDEGKWVDGVGTHSMVIAGHLVPCADADSKNKIQASPQRYLNAAKAVHGHHLVH